MRFPFICLLAASCAAPTGHESTPPPGLAVLTTVSVSQNGVPFSELSTTLWKGREAHLEALGPEPEPGETGYGLEFDRTPAGDRTLYLGIPWSERLGPTTARAWTLEVPGREGPYLVHVEMNFDIWTITELSRPRFLHRPKYLR